MSVSYNIRVRGEMSVEDLSLVFPGGEPVMEGDLDRWLAEIEADPEVSATGMLLARSIVWQIRRRSN